MKIKNACIINWITDIILFILFSPFILVFFTFGYVARVFYRLKFMVGSWLLRCVDDITYDTQEEKNEFVGQNTARETYVLIKQHLKEKQKAYDETTKIINGILDESEKK